MCHTVPFYCFHVYIVLKVLAAHEYFKRFYCSSVWPTFRRGVGLRSSTDALCIKSQTVVSEGQAFALPAPRNWNSLPDDVTFTPSLPAWNSDFAFRYQTTIASRRGPCSWREVEPARKSTVQCQASAPASAPARVPRLTGWGWTGCTP